MEEDKENHHERIAFLFRQVKYGDDDATNCVLDGAGIDLTDHGIEKHDDMCYKNNGQKS